jgi:hypothetical protein
MLTASRVVGAVYFALLAWFVCEFIKMTLPDDTNPGLLSEITAGVGFVLGWRIAGPHQREGYNAGFSTGITTAVALAFCGVFLHAGIEMIRLSMRLRYDGAMEAVVAMFSIAGKYAMIAATPWPLMTLFIGGAIGGLTVEWASRRWN